MKRRLLLCIKDYTDKFINLLFIIFLFEITLGGSGRLIGVGFFSIRIFLFSLILLLTIKYFFNDFIKNQKNKILQRLLLIFTIGLAIGVLVALFNKNNFLYIYIDIKPLLYFFSLIFITYYLQNENNIIEINRIIKFSSLLMAVLYLFCFLLINIETKWFDYDKFYDFLYPIGEFFFRGSVGFFYKGFFYLCIGFIFYFFDYDKKSKWIAFIIFIAIFLTFTRGFLIGLILSFLFYYIIIDYKSYKKILRIILIGSLITISLFLLLKFSFNYLEENSVRNKKKELNRTEISDQQRIEQIKEVLNDMSVSTIIQGHGFGKGVKIRFMHMEISFLEIIHKQGLIGVFIWLYMLFIATKLYLKLLKRKIHQKATPYFFSVLFTFFVSLTNPFMNNPLGLTIIIISIVYMNVLINNETDDKYMHSNI
ncbi:MAG: O-antigen ligase family protein [Bacteroidetes bacterium]|nr:O-antigen ligase family protein [Bacteroidota bacterium]